MSSIWDRLVVEPSVRTTKMSRQSRECSPKAAKPKAENPRPHVNATPGAMNIWGLSSSQLHAVDLLAHGYDYYQIAKIMGISRKTLDVHLGRARERMAARSNVILVAMWFRVNLLLEVEEARRLTNERLAAKLMVACHDPRR